MTPPSSAFSIWHPLASESQRAVVLPILDELEFSLTSSQEERSPSLSEGMAGQALFLGYLSKLPGKEVLKDRAVDLLRLAVEQVGMAHGAKFFSGYTGIAWAIEHVQQQILAVGEDNANEDVDEVLLGLLGESPWRQDYDLISGLVGYGVYALERLSIPSARQILARVLGHLETLVIPRTLGHSWATSPDLLPRWQQEKTPKGYLNLGLAHGVPGVLLILAALEKMGGHYLEFDSQCARKLLEGGMTWLFSQFQDPEVGSYLNCWCPLDQEKAKPQPNRVGWCYGDLGASLAILNVARLVAKSNWESKALDMARLAAERPLAISGVLDTALCHGSAGNMIIFQRLFHLTGEDCFHQAAQLYLDHLISAGDRGRPFAGYAPPRPGVEIEPHTKDQAPSNQSNSGLLEGASGAGLALLSALGIEPKWDRFMMLSLPDLC